MKLSPRICLLGLVAISVAIVAVVKGPDAIADLGNSTKEVGYRTVVSISPQDNYRIVTYTVNADGKPVAESIRIAIDSCPAPLQRANQVFILKVRSGGVTTKRVACSDYKVKGPLG